MKNSLLLVLPLLLSFFSCTIRDKQPPLPPAHNAYDSVYALVEEAEAQLKDGDLITRTGIELSSQFIRQLSQQDKSYSHSGIVFIENGRPFVYHIVTGGENPDGRILRDSLRRFCNPRKNSGFGIFRFDMDSAEVRKFRESILTWKEAGVRFDSTFNLHTDDRMYCSEMITKGISRATANRIRFETTKPTEKQADMVADRLHLNRDYARNMRVFTIDNLYLNPHCRAVQQYRFTSPQ